MLLTHIKISENWHSGAGMESSRLSSTRAPLPFCSPTLVVWLLSLRSSHGSEWLLELQLSEPHSRHHRRRKQKGKKNGLQVKSAPFKDLIPDITYNTDRAYLISHTISARNVGHTQIWIIQGQFNYILPKCEQARVGKSI